MIGLVAQLLLAVAVMSLFLGLPGWAASRLLQTQLVLPAVVAPVVWFVLGLGVWTLALVPSLTWGWPSMVTVVIHAALTVVLVAGALLRGRRVGHAKSDGRDRVERWTLVGIAVSVLLAAALRTRIAFDTLFHIGLARRLLELPHPYFDTVDRIVGSGVNPAYLVPTWQGALGAVAGLTGLDPATVMEAMAPLAVLLGACAAAGFGRVLTGRAAGEVAAVGAYAWLRVWFPRRELEGDGVAFAALPGNLAIDVLLPLALTVALIIATRGRAASSEAPARPVGRGVYVLVACTTALFVLLHANYSVYLAVIGAGFLLWLLVVEGARHDVLRRGFAAMGSIAIPGIVTLAAVLPALVLLDHFGDPADQRIDYHLVGSGAWEVIRPGHFYDAFGAGGLLAMLVLPFAVAHVRGPRRALLGGGALAMLSVGLVPPLLELMSRSGSMTLGLRLPRPFGVLLVATLAVAISWLVQELRVRSAQLRATRGRFAALLAYAVPLVLLLGLTALYGYPLSRHEPPQYGWNWPTLVGVVGLLVVAVRILLSRGRSSDPRDPQPVGRSAAAATGIAVLLLSVALAPSGLISLKRATWQSRQLVASVRADDLACYSAIQPSLERLPAGSVVLADPVTAYGIQALGPIRVIADFKTWNGATDSEGIQERIDLVTAAFDSPDEHPAADALGELRTTYTRTSSSDGRSMDRGARYLVVARGNVVPPIDSSLPDFDAIGLRAALASGRLPARRIAAGPGRLPANASDEQRDRCDLELWKLT